MTSSITGEPESGMILGEGNGMARTAEKTAAHTATHHGPQMPPLPSSAIDWALFLDLDGPLLNLALTPDDVQISPQLCKLLTRFQNCLRGAVALVSGRSIETLDQLFEPAFLPTAGLYGAERRNAHGELFSLSVPDEKLQELSRGAQEIALKLPGVLLEDKRYIMAFHYGNARWQRTALRAAITTLAMNLGFEVKSGRDMYEIKPRDTDKGAALAAFMSEAPFSGRKPILLSDGISDERALNVINTNGGMAIEVGDHGFSAANFILHEPADAFRWLYQWQERIL
jgi:trehalose 6-phosphate phosphatase